MEIKKATKGQEQEKSQQVNKKTSKESKFIISQDLLEPKISKDQTERNSQETKEATISKPAKDTKKISVENESLPDSEFDLQITTKQTEDINPKCTHLKGEEKLYFCNVCSKFVCRMCPCLKKHKACNIEDQMPKTIESLNESIKKLKEVFDTNTSSIDKIHSLNLKNMEMARKNKKTKLTEELVLILQEDEKTFSSLLENLTKTMKDLTNQINQLQETVTAKISAIEQAKDTIKYSTEKIIPFLMIKAYYYAKEIDELVQGIKPIGNISKFCDEFENLSSYKGDFEALNNAVANFRKTGTEKAPSILYDVNPLSDLVVCCDIKTKKSKKKKFHDFKFFLNAGVTFKENTIFLAGGTENFVNHTNCAIQLDLNSLEVINLPNLKFARSENCLVILGNLLLCIGGRNNFELVDSIELLNFSKQQDGWAIYPNMKISSCFAAASASEIQGKAYVFGGLLNEKMLNDLYVYTLATGQWVLLSMQNLPHLHSAGLFCSNSLGGDVIIMGGATNIGKTTISSDVIICKNGQATKRGELKNPDCFYGKIALQCGNTIFIIGDNYLHEYGDNINSIPLTEWYPL